ncbi:Endopolyphosphatase [Apophysomyces ossiformis]|uniref:Endopolyphosphatase n=1 Tax=Apophysomyces ossiformis TaxID=679940 RepID=A0A8H7BT03_9FUNG|nr:Endopolyphosphatase [Apophysomyces ossiformis]
MKENIQDIDFIIYTGDTARHDRDDKVPRTKNDVLHDHKAVIKYFTNTFDVSKIKWIPTIGNNDMPDHNQIGDNDPLYSTLEDMWKPFQLNLTESFHLGGYFVQDDVVPGLRIINVNSMLFYRSNHVISNCDKTESPGAIQLNWLEKMLEESRRSNNKVYILSHVPPNDDKDNRLYKKTCQAMYYNLLGEYGDTIVGHFTGHTNDDRLTAVVKDKNGYSHVTAVVDKLKNQKIATMLFHAPSIIPKNNPAMRVYNYASTGSQDTPVGTIKDWTQYYVDLKKANKEGVVNYTTEYKASELFGVNKFDATNIGKIFQDLQDNKNVQKKYVDYITVLAKESKTNDD